MQVHKKSVHLASAGEGFKKPWLRHALVILQSLCFVVALCACGSEPTGMQRPVDGSSVSAFEQSEQALRAELTADQYSAFKRAVNYLQLKAFDAPTIADFYQSLDGKTAEQIIAMAEAHRTGN